MPVEAFSIYRGLRTVNPSPYMYFLDFEDFQIAGASPEPLIKVTGRRVETRPIAGTYPRGSDEEEDRRNAEDLLADPKERAEHVMLVDLGRNDLGRVCEYGSVEVEELMVVETYSHVLHIVSRVAGTLRPEVGAMDALRACLPAGTLSGAPKVRAMQIIDELEPHKRCSYGGAIGYLGFDGDLDTAIHIRTVVVKDGVAHVQAGGGTVADAKPDFEYRESVNKAKAVFSAVELAEPEGLAVRRHYRHMLLSHLKVLNEGLVIDNYDSFTYNLVQYLGELGAEMDVVRNDKAEVAELLERKPDRLVISPGPCTPAEAGISVEASRAFPEAGVPTLGVCLGHQAMVEAFGGTVDHGRSRSTARTPRSSTTGAPSSPASRARWRPGATTR